MLLVTNPVDVVTYVAQEISGLPANRVIGSGTVLDTSRLRHLLAERLGVGVNSVHATIVGEHGDSEIALWSSASVGGTALLDVVGPTGGQIRADELDGLLLQVRTAAYTIIEGKGATNLAIGLAAVRIMRSVADDERAVLPVSVRLVVDGVGPVCLSLPSVVGRGGVLGRLDPARRGGAGRLAGQRTGDPSGDRRPRNPLKQHALVDVRALRRSRRRVHVCRGFGCWGRLHAARRQRRAACSTVFGCRRWARARR